ASQRGVWLALGCGYATRIRTGAAGADPSNAGEEPDVSGPGAEPGPAPPVVGGLGGPFPGGRPALGPQATSHAATTVSASPRQIAARLRSSSFNCYTSAA